MIKQEVDLEQQKIHQDYANVQVMKTDNPGN